MYPSEHEAIIDVELFEAAGAAAPAATKRLGNGGGWELRAPQGPCPFS